MGKIRIGTPDYLSIRPLIYGLTRRRDPGWQLVYGEPGELATALEREQLDIALIPSIEYLRGVGRLFIAGPALVLTGGTGGLLLATDRPISDIDRVAVAENSRTPVAALRILLDKAYHVTPDFCVFKGETDKWQDEYDAILLTGDQGIRYRMTNLRANEICHDLGEMWCSLYPSPLVLALWAYNNARIGSEFRPVLTDSRDLGVNSLSLLAEGVARTTEYDSQFVYEYLNRGWGYSMGPLEEGGLRLLEDHAIDYQLIQRRRLAGVPTGQR